MSSSYCARITKREIRINLTVIYVHLHTLLLLATLICATSKSVNQATSRPRKKRRTTTSTTPFSPRTNPTTCLWLHLQTTSAQDLLFPPGHFKNKEEKEEQARALKANTEIKQDQASISPLNPSPDSELYWSPWLYSDIVIPDHPSGSSALTCSLPPFPHCPVRRPDMSFAFSQEHPQLASIYQEGRLLTRILQELDLLPNLIHSVCPGIRSGLIFSTPG